MTGIYFSTESSIRNHSEQATENYIGNSDTIRIKQTLSIEGFTNSSSRKLFQMIKDGLFTEEGNEVIREGRFGDMY